ncbi:MAG TPA: zinc-binding dehydrogenase [Thermoanaerobaculia bacterium]|nr:zinc-binding dehydrogenase [Thermoanaerobaculia bacterium]
MRAWIKHEGRLQLRETSDPQPRSNELLVRVEAFSLNRGELRTAALAADGTIPGWDVAGTVVATAPGGPPIGTRVAAMTSGGAWAELAAVPVHTTAEIPEDLSTSIAATLPLAGLTVMRALAVAGPLLGKRALVTGQRGGVGMLAMQLLPLAGADATGCRSAADVTGDYDFILESAGGDSFTAAIDRIAPRGTIVTIGNSSERDSTINVRNIYRKGAVTIYGLIIFEEVEQRRLGTRELRYLLDATARGSLQIEIGLERDWQELEQVLPELEQRRFGGKAVLHVR